MVDDKDNNSLDENTEAQLPEPVEPYPQNAETEDENQADDTAAGASDVSEQEFSDAFDEEDDEDLEISDEASHLASHPGRNMVMMGAIMLASAVVLYFILFSGDDKKEPEPEVVQTVDPKNVRSATQETFIQEPDVGVIAAPSAPNINEIEAPEALPLEDPEPEDLDVVDIPFDNTPPEFFEEPAVPAVDVPLPADPVPELPASPELPSEIGALPEAPGLEPIPGGSSLPSPEEQAAIDAKRRSGIMLMNGGSASDGLGGGLFGGDGGGDPTAPEQDPNVLGPTSATQSFATILGNNTNSVVAQGKMIDAVLETAINTDLPGVLRAIVSRDIYAESGKKILIPKGSRLIGNYEAEVSSGQNRVFVVWTRIIRPDGIDVIIDSPGVDTLGRAGIAGTVDTRFMEIFGNAVLLSALTVTGAYVLETITGASESTSSTTTSSDGSTTSSSTGTPTSFAIAEAAESLSDTASDIAAEGVNTSPRITVPQGSRIKVFVNSDLIFPSSVSQKVRFIN